MKTKKSIINHLIPALSKSTLFSSQPSTFDEEIRKIIGLVPSTYFFSDAFFPRPLISHKYKTSSTVGRAAQVTGGVSKGGTSLLPRLGEHAGLNLTRNNRTFCGVPCTVSAHGVERTRMAADYDPHSPHGEFARRHRFDFQFNNASSPEQVSIGRLLLSLSLFLQLVPFFCNFFFLFNLVFLFLFFPWETSSIGS